jgi:spore photoproduct lyase
MDNRWRPSEIIVHEKVKDDPVTGRIRAKCPGVPVRFVSKGTGAAVVDASQLLKASGKTMLQKILAGKKVLYISPAASGVVDTFYMPDERILCPHFRRLKLASNGCFYRCDWCYLKLTYRAAFPFITVRAQYDQILTQLQRALGASNSPLIFNSGELADSLALEHLTGAAKKFIPWFGSSKNGYLFMLTKSDHVESNLNLAHNRRTIIAWSLNGDFVSRKFEIGSPHLERRLLAAKKAQQAGYPLRIRLDPIVPYDGWQRGYSDTIKRIFEQVCPQGVTLGTLRFEEVFFKMRGSIFASGPELPALLEQMRPMFSPKSVAGKKRPLVGKYSFDEERRVEIFKFVIRQIRMHWDGKLALCKESESVWRKVGLEPSEQSCVCQL